MSDQEKKNLEQVVEEAETSDTDTPVDVVDEPEPHEPIVPATRAIADQPPAAPRKSSSAIAWLALLLVLA